MSLGLKKKLTDEFIAKFGPDVDIRIFFAPGRVNLIGEHTDYNGGHVFPCALSLGTYAAVRVRTDSKIRLYSMNFENDGIIEADSEKELVNSPAYKWANYPLGIVQTFKKRGYAVPAGFDILFYGTIPNGSGLSSSASIEVLTGFCLKELFRLDVTKKDLALIGQDSENHFNGMNCGIMDQFASAFGKAGHAIFLDTATLDYEYVPVDLKGIKIVISNTNKKHELTSSGYNDRRRESETALKDLQSVTDIKALGELNEETFNKYSSAIKDEVCFRRARHAVTENLRTIEAVKALNAGDIVAFGKLMNASHKSLDKDYEVTCPELNIMAETEQKLPGVIGARMTGGGFGGCTVALVLEECIDALLEKTKEIYKAKTGIDPDFYIVDIGDGPSEINS
ncbi:MAG: galactokinase [Lachnospiraceae bacterium]|nr:galactokinase [Lachnospiraceae bacterium]